MAFAGPVSCIFAPKFIRYFLSLALTHINGRYVAKLLIHSNGKRLDSVVWRRGKIKTIKGKKEKESWEGGGFVTASLNLDGWLEE